MYRVILQPAGDDEAKENYSNTISTPVQLTYIEKYLSEDQVSYLKQIYGNKAIPVWGITPGKKDRKRKEWERIQKGDVTLFTANNKIFSTAVVTSKIHNRQLAEALWGWEEEGVTWEYVYFLDEVKNHVIPVAEFNGAVGYSLNYVIRGFRVLDENMSSKILEHFSFASDKHFPDVSEDEYETSVEQYISMESLDTTSVGRSRKEQAFLRKSLFGNKEQDCCGICGEEYPIEFLVSAHIKKRAECTKEEKLDYKNIVMPMCTFGCDDLYEKGYISVVNGIVYLLKADIKLTPILNVYIAKIIGRECVYWNDQTEKYFKWHFKHHSR